MFASSAVFALTHWCLPLLLSLLLLFSTAVKCSADAYLPLNRSVVLDPHGNYILSWTAEEEHVTFEVQVKTNGYVGLGFSRNGGMKGADIVLGWITPEGEVALTDRYATESATPLVDASQDIALIFGARNNTHTTLRFRRPWITCDTEHDMALTTNTIRIIYAIGDNFVPTNQTAATIATLPGHNHSGVKSMLLRGNPPDKSQLPTDVQHWDVRAPNVSLPNSLDTLYWCKLYKLPELQGKHHYIGYVPLIDHASSPYVHHMVLYECHVEDSVSILGPYVEHIGTQCYSGNMPLSWLKCNTPIVGWAVGSEGGMLPAHVGEPLGEQYSGSTYFMLETHFNNPNKESGVRDSSGLRLYYTATLRQHDAGMAIVGHSFEPTQIIGPGISNWTTVGHCSAKCTSKALPSEGIHVLGGVVHAHLLGRGITLRHVRNGIEQPPIMADEDYDFNYQQDRLLEKERTLLPGDHVMVECRYDSTQRTGPTFGGFGTADEMCVAFMLYYPRVATFSGCQSRTDMRGLLPILGVKDINGLEILGGLGTKPRVIKRVESLGAGRHTVRHEAGMATLQEAGAGSTQLNLSKLLQFIKIKEPLAMQNMSLLELLNQSSLWGEGDTSKKIVEYFTKGSYVVDCMMQGRVMAMPYQVDQQTVFQPYTPTPPPCTPGKH